MSDPTQQVQIFKKVCQRPLLSAAGCHTRLDVQHCPLGTYQGIFFIRAEKLSQDTHQHSNISINKQAIFKGREQIVLLFLRGPKYTYSNFGDKTMDQDSRVYTMNQ
jgi:hypothetical protein